MKPVTLGVLLAIAGGGVSACIDVPQLVLRGAAADGVAGDAGASPTDATLPRDDGSTMPDVAVSPEDARAAHDAQGPTVDGTLPVDGAADARRQPKDATPEPDIALPPADARGGPLDGAAPDALLLADLRVPPHDALVLVDMRPASDAAVMTPDAAVVTLDAAPPPPLDAAVVPPDAAPPPPLDAAVVPPDAAPPPPDAAPPPLDLGEPPPAPWRVNVPAPLLALRFGQVVATVPDQNRDGYADALVSAPGTPFGTPTQMTGSVYLIDGRTGLVLAHVQGRSNGDHFGVALLVADITGDATPEVAVGAPDDNGGRGRTFLYQLPGLVAFGSTSGDNGNSQTGQGLVPVHCMAPVRPCLGSFSAGAGNQPHLMVYESIFAAGAQRLQRSDSLVANVASATTFGTRALVAPSAAGGGGAVEDTIALIDRGGGEREVERFQTDGNLTPMTRYVAPNASNLYGAALAVVPVPAADALLAVGDPGSATGVVQLFARDVHGAGGGLFQSNPTGGIHPASPDAAAFGTSLTSAPLYPTAAAGPGLCVGDPGNNAHPGHVECVTTGGMGPVLIVSADVPGDAFGTALAASTTADPDGTFLLVVGAPATTGLGGLSVGRVELIHVPPQP